MRRRGAVVEERREVMEKGGLTLKDDEKENRKTLNVSFDFLCRCVTLFSAALHRSKCFHNSGDSSHFRFS